MRRFTARRVSCLRKTQPQRTLNRPEGRAPLRSLGPVPELELSHSSQRDERPERAANTARVLVFPHGNSKCTSRSLRPTRCGSATCWESLGLADQQWHWKLLGRTKVRLLWQVGRLAASAVQPALLRVAAGGVRTDSSAIAPQWWSSSGASKCANFTGASGGRAGRPGGAPTKHTRDWLTEALRRARHFDP